MTRVIGEVAFKSKSEQPFGQNNLIYVVFDSILLATCNCFDGSSSDFEELSAHWSGSIFRQKNAEGYRLKESKVAQVSWRCPG